MNNPVFLISQLMASPRLSKRIILGAGIGFLLISLFLILADGSQPEWGNFWMVRPLLVVPFAGAMGGVFYTFMDPWRRKGGIYSVMANLISVLVFLFGLWIGSVLGLDGTYWD
ncbi:MAG: hypothetical protein P8Z38_02260 [Robiginitalea sp.]